MSGRYFIDHGMWHDRKTGRHLEDIVSDTKPSDRLAKLLEVVADHDQTPEEARAELEADGVDVDGFLRKVVGNQCGECEEIRVVGRDHRNVGGTPWSHDEECPKYGVDN